MFLLLFDCHPLGTILCRAYCATVVMDSPSITVRRRRFCNWPVSTMPVGPRLAAPQPDE